MFYFLFSSKMTYNCVVCYDDFEQNNCNHFKCQYCGSYYCADCMNEYVSNFKFKQTIFPTVTCSNCNNVIPFDSILLIVNKQVLDKLFENIKITIKDNIKSTFTEEIRDHMKKFIVPTNLSSYSISATKFKTYQDVVCSIEQIPNLVYNYNKTNKVNIAPQWFNKFLNSYDCPKNFKQAISEIKVPVVTIDQTSKPKATKKTTKKVMKKKTIVFTETNTNSNTNDDSERILYPTDPVELSDEDAETIYEDSDNLDSLDELLSVAETSNADTNSDTSVYTHVRPNTKTNNLKKMKIVPIETTECQSSFVEILKVMCRSWKLRALNRIVDEQINSYLSYITAILKDFVCEIVCWIYFFRYVC